MTAIRAPSTITGEHSSVSAPLQLLFSYAYYGEYPLAFAACFGNKDIYDLLIQYGADPDRQDVFGERRDA